MKSSSLFCCVLLLFTSVHIIHAQGVAKQLALCESQAGIVGLDNFQFSMLAHFALNPAAGEELIFVVRPIPSNGPIQVQISVKYQPPNTGLQQKVSDPTTGLLILSDIVQNTPIQIEIIKAPMVLTKEHLPFTFFSFISNSRICAVEVMADHSFSIPLLSGVVPDPTNNGVMRNAVMYVKIRAPMQPNTAQILPHFSVNVDRGQAQSSVRLVTVADSSVIPATFPILMANGRADGNLAAPVSLNSALFLEITPTISGRTADVFSMTTDWSASPFPQPTAPGGNNVPPGWNPGTASVAPVPSEEGGVFGAFFTFIFVITIVYFVARSVYNYRNGVTTFPQYVPHHEEIGSAVSNVKQFITGAASRSQEGLRRTRHGGYDDVENEPAP